MDAHAGQTDKAIGVALALGIVAILGSAIMFAGDTQLFRAWGFAAALLAAGLTVMSIQLYGN